MGSIWSFRNGMSIMIYQDKWMINQLSFCLWSPCTSLLKEDIVNMLTDGEKKWNKDLIKSSFLCF